MPDENGSHEDVEWAAKTTTGATKGSSSSNPIFQPNNDIRVDLEAEEEQEKTLNNSETLVERGHLTTRTSSTGLPPPSDDEIPHEDINPRKGDRIDIVDWSQTGRGSHVEFKFEETVPLEQGRFLGRGAVGDVYETTVQGWKLAHKRVVIKRKIGDTERKEIEILKRLSAHVHMIQLVGTYTHRQFLGLLLYPIAVCDLHTFFEDVEAWSTVKTKHVAPAAARIEAFGALDTIHKDRLEALHYGFPSSASRSRAWPAYSKMGCLISAIAYLHDQKIRHKDLKPSNILLSRDQLWLSDFGSATDFSLLSQSATDNERGTPRYFSPEVAAWTPNGRAADIFSLGCVLLEIVVLHNEGTLEHIRRHRSADPSFHANLDKVGTWCMPLERTTSYRRYHISREIRQMLSKDPKARPTAKQLLIRMTAYDIVRVTTRGGHSIFGECCKSLFVSAQQHEEETLGHKSKAEALQRELDETKKSLRRERSELLKYISLYDGIKDGRRYEEGRIDQIRAVDQHWPNGQVYENSHQHTSPYTHGSGVGGQEKKRDGKVTNRPDNTTRDSLSAYDGPKYVYNAKTNSLERQSPSDNTTQDSLSVHDGPDYVYNAKTAEKLDYDDFPVFRKSGRKTSRGMDERPDVSLEGTPGSKSIASGANDKKKQNYKEPSFLDVIPSRWR